MIALVDSGGANLASVIFALQRLDKPFVFTADPDVIRTASHVILPGVGAAGTAMGVLRRAGLVECLRALTQPLIGICLGMQLLFDWSAEGDADMLGLLPGRAERFEERGLTVPHMGWNTLEILGQSPLLRGLSSGAYVYFVHSFRLAVSAVTLAQTEYGGSFSAVVARDNVFGCQFHPERSSANGALILKNFTEL